MFKEKEEIIVVAVLAIIISALLAGYGVYYIFGKQLTEAIEPQPSQTSSGAESNLLFTITPAPKTTEEKTGSMRKRLPYTAGKRIVTWGIISKPGLEQPTPRL